MELSEREKRLLREMETQLQAEDPGLASSLVVHRLRPGARAVLATLGLLIGVGLMAVGISRAHLLGIAVALTGYLVLLASTTVAVETLRARGDSPFLARAAGRARRAS